VETPDDALTAHSTGERFGRATSGTMLLTLMKPGAHTADYRPVVFRDQSAGSTILTKSTVKTSKTLEWEDGNTYPLVDVEISMFSHPFYTGKMKMLDAAGRVERFEKRFGKRK
jgi:large subunit ribosomal protein L31